MGDFNIRGDKQEDWDTKLLKEVEINLGLIQISNDFIRITEKSKSIIDLASKCGNEMLMEKFWVEHTPKIMDHSWIDFTFQMEVKKVRRI